MKKNYFIWIGLGVVTAGLIIYFVYFRKKKQTVSAGGVSQPADEIDWTSLQKTFATSNPYNGDKVKKIEEVSAVGENDPAPHPLEPDKVKIKITKSQFDQRVLQDIQRHINQKTDSVREVNAKLTDWWEPWSRAGVNNSLARALAYNSRVFFATNFYYEDAGTPTNTAVTPTPTPTPTPPPPPGNTPTNSTGGLTAQRYSY